MFLRGRIYLWNVQSKDLVVNNNNPDNNYIGENNSTPAGNRIDLAIQGSEFHSSSDFLKSYYRLLFDRISDVILIIDPDGKIRETNPSFERIFGYSPDEVRGLDLLSLVNKEDLLYYRNAIEELLKDPEKSISFDGRFCDKKGEYRDLVGRISNLISDTSVGGLLIIGSDTTEQRRWEAILGQYSHRLEVLRKIQNGILKAESPETISKAALDHIHGIISCTMACITLFDPNKLEIRLLAAIGDFPPKLPSLKMERIDEIQSVLKHGEWFEIEDVNLWVHRSPLFEMFSHLGIKKVFFVPMLIRGELIGSLNIAFLPDEIVRLDHLEAAREIADMLALAIQQSRLLEAEQRQRQQAEIIRDAISSIATSLNFQHILADLLSSLKLLIPYDSAKVVLIEEESLKVAAGSGLPENANIVGKGFSIDNKIFHDLQKFQQPIILTDASKDRRFRAWKGLEYIRAWLGVPLISHNGMIGYLSLDSRQPGTYDGIDMDPILVFADHVAVAVENAWLYEETLRRAKELGAIARVSTSLRKARTIQEMMNTLLDKTLEAIEADEGLIYAIDGSDLVLSAAVGIAAVALGARRSKSDNPLFETLLEAKSLILSDQLEPDLVKRWIRDNGFYANASCLVFIPLVTTEGPVGVMCLSLHEPGEIDNDKKKIIESIADMASNALYRVIMMGQLENRVADQTRDLTILYEVSSITSQALELKEMLLLSMDRLLSFTSNSFGVIYRLNSNNSELRLVVQRRFPADNHSGSLLSQQLETGINPPEVISLLENSFFEDPLSSGGPHVIPNLTTNPQTPAGFIIPELNSYIGIPIKGDGRILGMLCLFSKTLKNVSIEQMTLLSAVADQLGIAFDSNRLRQRAAQAAVFEERQRLARDLHDSVTQSLYSLTLLAEGYRRKVPQGSNDEIQSWLEDLEEVSLQALKEMRLLLYELKPATFQEDGLLDALNRRLQSVETRSGMKVNFSVDPKTHIPAIYQENLYGIAQEALNNTIKHSGADSIDIHLGHQAGSILLEIQDNGKGFSTAAAYNDGGLGLAGMSERARKIGGELSIQSSAETGTKISVLIPGGNK
jgi:PAS domain S-box-containing protein